MGKNSRPDYISDQKTFPKPSHIAMKSLIQALLMTTASAQLPRVPSFDISRYTGTWFEIAASASAREPVNESSPCGCTSATYGIIDGAEVPAVTVFNQCLDLEDGEPVTISGNATLIDPPSGLNVQFPSVGIPPFVINYVVFYVEPVEAEEPDQPYQFALVGSDPLEDLFVLSREPI